MLSIDEAIKHAREVAETCECEASKYDMCDSYESQVAYQEGKCAEEHEQLATWLEELKAYREIGTVEGYKNAIECYTREYTIRKSNIQYDKAIDDAKSVILQTLDNEILVDTLHLRLEQLKERNNE